MRIDRLARSIKDLQVIVAKLRDRGANIAATEQPVDTSTAAGKAFFDMLGVFAEFETNLRRERQSDGIVAARRRGVCRGRPPAIDMEEIRTREASDLFLVCSSRRPYVQLRSVWAGEAALLSFVPARA